MGVNTLTGNLTGSYNTAIGYQSLLSNEAGSQNTAIGYEALRDNTADDNVALGYYALVQNSSGSGNTAVGRQAFYSNITGSENTALGFLTDVVEGVNNSTAIGARALADESNLIQLGNESVSKVRTSGQLILGAITLPNTDGTNGQVLTTDGSGTVSWQTPSSPAARDVYVPVHEVADEFVFADNASGFQLTQTPANDSKVKMFINGMRVFNAAYTITGSSVTYDPAKNKGILLRKGDVVQFDYYY